MTLPRLAITLLCSLVLGGCVTAQVEELRQGSVGMDHTTESIVIVGREHNNAYETSDKFTDCVARQLGGGSTPIDVYPERAFVDGLYPWFEPRTAPLSPDALPSLLARGEVAEALEEINVRYLVWIDGTTEVDSSGGMSCSVGPGGGGCFGFITSDKSSSFEASIWDLENLESVGRISSDASGTSYIPAFVVPIPLIARTEGSACSGLADQLRDFLLTKPT